MRPGGEGGCSSTESAGAFCRSSAEHTRPQDCGGAEQRSQPSSQQAFCRIAAKLFAIRSPGAAHLYAQRRSACTRCDRCWGRSTTAGPPPAELCAPPAASSTPSPCIRPPVCPCSLHAEAGAAVTRATAKSKVAGEAGARARRSAGAGGRLAAQLCINAPGCVWKLLNKKQASQLQEGPTAVNPGAERAAILASNSASRKLRARQKYKSQDRNSQAPDSGHHSHHHGWTEQCFNTARFASKSTSRKVETAEPPQHVYNQRPPFARFGLGGLGWCYLPAVSPNPARQNMRARTH